MATVNITSTPPVDEMDHDHLGSPGKSIASAVPSTGVASKELALQFLRSLLNKNLRVTTNDGRMFCGAFKCTDPESNIVLQYAYEYRQPSARKLAAAASIQSASSVKLEMISRYLGLIVIPGQYIVIMEVEEFASQIKRRS